jgi:hypothetical protein
METMTEVVFVSIAGTIRRALTAIIADPATSDRMESLWRPMMFVNVRYICTHSLQEIKRPK